MLAVRAVELCSTLFTQRATGRATRAFAEIQASHNQSFFK